VLIRKFKLYTTLVEERLPWDMIEGIGVCSFEWADRVKDILEGERHKPPVKPEPDWYY